MNGCQVKQKSVEKITNTIFFFNVKWLFKQAVVMKFSLDKIKNFLVGLNNSLKG